LKGCFLTKNIEAILEDGQRKKLEIGTRLPQIKFRALILGGVQRRVAKLLKFVLDVLGHRMNSIQRSYCFGGCAETIPD